MGSRRHPTRLSGGDRKALGKELGWARAMTSILAAQAAKAHIKGEALIKKTDRLLCESWNERSGPMENPLIPRQLSRSGDQWRLSMTRNRVLALRAGCVAPNVPAGAPLRR
jgi:hypothetical protein